METRERGASLLGQTKEVRSTSLIGGTRELRSTSLLGGTPPNIFSSFESSNNASSSNNVPVIYHTRSNQISEIKRMFVSSFFTFSLPLFLFFIICDLIRILILCSCILSLFLIFGFLKKNEEDTQGVIPESDKEEIKDDLEITWHTEPIEDLLSKLGTDLKTGLTNDMANKKYLEDGPNSLDPPKRNGILFQTIIIKIYIYNLTFIVLGINNY